MSKEPAFEGVDINHILNDKSLYNELIGLGWVDDSVPAPAPRAMAPRVAPPAATHAAAHADVDIPDISGIGMIDEHQMALTEDDLKDSDLLAEFEGLQNGDDGAWSMESDAAAETVDSVPALPVPAPKIAPAPAPAPVAPSALAPSQPISSPAASTGSGIPTAVEAKQRALHFKREGNNAEALKWLRYVKQIESGGADAVPEEAAVTAVQPYIQTAPRPVSVKVPSQAPARAPSAVLAPSATVASPTAEAREVSWAALEAALTEATKHALKEAKFLNEAGDKKKAVVRMREYKALQQETAVLEARRLTHGAVPALFHWETSRKEAVVETVELGEDEVRIEIEGVFGANGLIESHSSRSVSISYTLGIAKDEAQPPATPAANCDCKAGTGGQVQLDYALTLPVLRRGRHMQASFARMKATFELVLHRGFWKGSEVLVSAVLPLGDLVTARSVGGELELRAAGKEGGKRGKVVGGQLRARAYVRIRSPLGGPEVTFT